MAALAATASITDGKTLKIIESLPQSTTIISQHAATTNGNNANLKLNAEGGASPQLIRRYLSSSNHHHQLTSPIAGAIIGDTASSTTMIGGQQLRLVHLVVNASSARSIAKSLREGATLEAISDPNRFERGVGAMKCSINSSTLPFTNIPTTASSAVSSSSSSSSSPTSPSAVAPSPGASSMSSDAESISSFALSSSSSTPACSLLPELALTCTICGKQYLERAEFNAHIKAHLKEKLHNRRNREEHTKAQKTSALQKPSPAPSINRERGATAEHLLTSKSTYKVPSAGNAPEYTLQSALSKEVHKGNCQTNLQEVTTTQPAQTYMSLSQLSHLMPQPRPTIPTITTRLPLSTTTTTFTTNENSRHCTEMKMVRPIPQGLLPSSPVPLGIPSSSSSIITAKNSALTNNTALKQTLLSAPKYSESLSSPLPPLSLNATSLLNGLSITPISATSSSLSNTVNMEPQPNLELLLKRSQLQQPDFDSNRESKPVLISPKVMAELAACKPVPISSASAEPSLSSLSSTPPSSFLPTASATVAPLFLLKDNGEQPTLVRIKQPRSGMSSVDNTARNSSSHPVHIAATAPNALPHLHASNNIHSSMSTLQLHSAETQKDILGGTLLNHCPGGDTFNIGASQLQYTNTSKHLVSYKVTNDAILAKHVPGFYVNPNTGVLIPNKSFQSKYGSAMPIKSTGTFHDTTNNLVVPLHGTRPLMGNTSSTFPKVTANNEQQVHNLP